MATEKITLTKVGRYEKNKEGQPYKWPSGDVYVRMAIKCREYGEAWLSGVASKWNENWKEGDTVEADVKKNGEYVNFNKPNPIDDLTKHFMALSVRVGKIEEAMKSLDTRVTVTATPAEMNEPPADFDDVNSELAGKAPEDLPF